MWIKSRLINALAFVGCVLSAGTALAQIPVELEGPISAIVDNGDGTANITVMGVTVSVPSTATIHTPTANLTISQLADQTPLPGRSESGFIGGTAIIIGDTNTAGTPVVAQDLFTEPAENVFVGVITAANCTTPDCAGPNDSLQILGTPLARLTDSRMPANPPTNAFGFEIDMTQGSLVGSPASVEGYFGNTDPALHYFILEMEGGVLRNPGTPEVSILRAQCRQRGDRGIELDVQGGVHDPANVTVQISDTNNPGVVFGSETAVQDAANAVFGLYDFRLRGDAAFATCPTSVTAGFPGATPAVLDVDVRIDVAGVPVPPPGPVPPVAVNDTAASAVNTPVTIAVLANDTDANGDALTVQSVASPTANNGTASINGSNVVYTPPADFTGTDSFTYTISDGNGGTATATVTVTVGDTTPPPGEDITLNSAIFRANKGRWIIRGRSAPNDALTAVIERTGEVIGVAQANARGRWQIRVARTAAQPGDNVVITSLITGNTLNAAVTVR